MMIRTIALIACLTGTTLALAAGQGIVYKWKDASGATHYSDAPPPQGISYTKVKAGITAGGDAPADSAPSKPDSDKPADTDASGAKPTQAQANAKLCEQARANVKLLQSTGPLMIERDGKQEALPDANRAGELKRAQAMTTLYCG